MSGIIYQQYLMMWLLLIDIHSLTSYVFIIRCEGVPGYPGTRPIKIARAPEISFPVPFTSNLCFKMFKVLRLQLRTWFCNLVILFVLYKDYYNN
jgi:hypothetical protein